MTMRHLEIFIAVAEAGKMNLAAKQLHLSQPTVSQAIQEIESQYRILLFERLSKKLFITDAGRELLDYARHIVSLFNKMEVTLQGHAVSMTLQVGATVTVGTCVFNTAIEAFERQNPEIQIHVTVDNTRMIEDRILKSQLDLAVVEGTISSPDIHVLPIIDDELVLVCGASHPFYGRSEIDFSELEGLPFVLREPGSGTRALFEDKLRDHQVTINEKWVCNNSEAIKNAVMEGQGLTVISRILVERELSERSLYQVPISHIQMNRHFCLVYHKNKYLSAPIKRLIQFMHDQHYSANICLQ